MVKRQGLAPCLLVSTALHAALLFASTLPLFEERDAPVENFRTPPVLGSSFELAELIRSNAAEPLSDQPEKEPASDLGGQGQATAEPLTSGEASSPADPEPTERVAPVSESTRSVAAGAPVKLPSSNRNSSDAAAGVQSDSGEEAADARDGATSLMNSGSLPNSVRSMVRVFTRSLPLIFAFDPSWAKLEVVELEPMEIRIEVDESGKLVEARALDEPKRSEYKELIRRVTAFLRTGRFQPAAEEPKGFTEVLRLRVRVLQREPSENPEYDANDVMLEGWDPPASGKPGRAYVRFNSGRQVEATVEFRPDLR